MARRRSLSASGLFAANQSHFERVVVPAGLAMLLGLTWLAHFNPITGLAPSKDSGVYLYVGQQMLRGSAVYRDLVDIKGPLVYIVNAGSLALFDGSVWSPYITEYALLVSASVLGYFGLRSRLGFAPAALAMLVWILLVNGHESGNLAEEWAWPLQWGAVYILSCRLTDKSERWWPALGAMGTAAFFIKMTCAGLWLALVIVLIAQAVHLRRFARVTRTLLLMAAGGGAVVLSLLSYLLLIGGLGAFLREYFDFAFAYVGHPTVAARLDVIAGGAHGMSYLTTGAIVAIWLLLTTDVARRGQRVAEPLTIFATTWLPVEVVISSLAGRGGRYTWTWLAPIALLVGIAANRVRLPKQGVFYLALVVAAIVGPLPHLYHSGRNLAGTIVHAHYYAVQKQYGALNEVVSYVEAHTAADDYVLVWADYSQAVNFVARRTSPTRFVFQPFLYKRDYAPYQLVPAFLADLQSHPPALILDSSPDAARYTPKPSLASVGTDWPGGGDKFAHDWTQVGEWLRGNYMVVGSLPTSRWLIYVPRSSARRPLAQWFEIVRCPFLAPSHGPPLLVTRVGLQTGLTRVGHPGS